jgi:hypothetical protein
MIVAEAAVPSTSAGGRRHELAQVVPRVLPEHHRLTERRRVAPHLAGDQQHHRRQPERRDGERQDGDEAHADVQHGVPVERGDHTRRHTDEDRRDHRQHEQLDGRRQPVLDRRAHGHLGELRLAHVAAQDAAGPVPVLAVRVEVHERRVKLQGDGEERLVEAQFLALGLHLLARHKAAALREQGGVSRGNAQEAERRQRQQEQDQS